MTILFDYNKLRHGRLVPAIYALPGQKRGALLAQQRLDKEMGGRADLAVSADL
jgi:hypothetical protein